MTIIANLLVGAIALLHVGILVAEMALWTRPRVRKVFGTTKEFARQTRVLAGNQGLYNGFLAAGLIWSLIHPDPEVARHLQYFFLGCVAVAGLYGAATASRLILFVQTVPAVVALLAVFFAG